MILARSPAVGHVAVLHQNAERAEAVARMLRAAGHRVTIIEPGRRVVQTIVERTPELLIASMGYSDPPLGGVVRAVRQALGADLGVLILVGRDDPDSLVEADEMVREPLEAGELDLRAGNLLRAQTDRRQLHRKVQELLGLYKISWAFSLAGGPTPLFAHLSRQCAEIVKAQKGLVLLFDRDRRQMVAQHEGFGLTREQVQRARFLVDGEARSRWNFRKNGPLVSNKAQADTRLMPEVAAELDLHSVLVVPLANGPRIHGLLLAADRASGAPFNDDDLNVLLAVAGQAAVAVENLRLHEELKRANDLLKEYDQVKSEFVAIVAHDFRRPLMTIRGFAELTLEEPDLPVETRQEFMKTVITETDALAALANDTLLITQMETGLLNFSWKEIDLGPFILDAMPMGLSDHSVLLDIPPQFPKVVADSARLRQVLNNLTTNAVKYSPSGGSITVRCRQRGADHLVIEVIDHGLGIPQEQLGVLFQKFSRVRSDEHMKIGGTGLGLYICRLIVEGHGGQIWVESELGKGSIFGLVIPLDAAAQKATGKKPAEIAASPTSTPAALPPREAKPEG